MISELQGGGSSVASDLSQNDRAVHVDFFNGKNLS